MSIPDIIRSDEKLRSLAMAVARNRVGANKPIESVLTAEFIKPAEFGGYLSDPVFKNYVLAYTSEFEKNGVSFAAKCRVLAEDAIKDLYYMVKDPDAPAAARVKAVENLVDWGGLAPKADAGAASRGSGFSITIQLPNAQEMTISASAPSTPNDPSATTIEGEATADGELGEFLVSVNAPPTTPGVTFLPPESENLTLDAVFEDVSRVLARPTPASPPYSDAIDPDYAD